MAEDAEVSRGHEGYGVQWSVRRLPGLSSQVRDKVKIWELFVQGLKLKV